MIREATNADVPKLVEMGVRFLRLYYAGKLKENREQMGKTVTALLTNPQGRMLVYENGNGIEGMLGLLVFPHYFSGEKVAGELVWWVDPEARGRAGMELLKQAEAEARALGAKWMQMVSPTERTAKLYERLGYAAIETTYQRSLL